MNPQQPQNPVQPIPTQPLQAAPTVANSNTQQSQVAQPQTQQQPQTPYQAIPVAPELQNNQIIQQDNPSSTQSSLLISELRDGLIIMKDGSFRAVIACKSINYDLMSEPERDSVEYGYKGVLNSLEFPIQILVRSQRIDIAPYLERLANIRRNNDNMLLGVLMDDYINFIDQVSQEANIMDKSFFVVVPYYSSTDLERASTQSKNIFSFFFGTREGEITRIDRNTYDKAVTEVNNRVQAVIGGLFNIGIHSVRLNTKELAELFYNFNNPDTAVREPFIDFNKMGTIYTKKGETPTKISEK